MEKRSWEFLKASLRMNKKDLIFDWSEVEAHRGWKGASILIAALAFGFSFSMIHVDFDLREFASVKSGSVMYLTDHEEGRGWRMIAEEEGPFPGRLEISSEHDVLGNFGLGAFSEDEAWNTYEISMRALESDSVGTSQRIAVQGQRYLPRIYKSESGVAEPGKAVGGLKPVLVPYTKESEQWLPKEYPEFQVEVKGEIDASGWRFVLNVDGQGRVKECMALHGGEAEGLAEITAWLKGLEFQKAEDEDRWFGLRVEFLNR